MSIFTPQAYLGGPPTSPTPPPTWLPSNNPSLAGWYDASDMSSHINSGGAIVGLESQDIYGDDLGAIGSTIQLGSQQNNLNTLYFSGINALYNNSTDVLVSPIGNHYAVGLFYPQYVSNVKDSIWSMKGTRDYDISAQMSNQWRGEIDLGNGVAANGSLGSFSTNRENQWIIVTILFNKTNLQSIDIKINGDVNSSQSTSYLNTLTSSQKLRIMTNRGKNYDQKGRFGELMLYKNSSGPNSTDWHEYSDKDEGYLAWKWGLQGNLPNAHPYKNAAPIP
tara:strand:- start:4673 stop:5506 length:834 start_codon:yes stop_codon:yes gene_type:complete